MLSLAAGSSVAMGKVVLSTKLCANGRRLPQLPTSGSTNSCNLFSFKEPSPLVVVPTRSTISSFKTAVSSVDSNQLTSSASVPPDDQQQARRYYFVVANAQFMLDEEEHFKELLFERLRNFGERNKEQDFWLVVEPKFLDNFPDITRRLKRPAVALVSTNGTWITFMKLRLDRVLSGSYEADTLEAALAYNHTSLQFEKPKEWLAPYPKYEYGWWEAFLPSQSHESKV